MNMICQPIIGEWYQDLDSSQLFEVVALDDENDSIGIQYFSGEISELDLESWRFMKLAIAAAPEDFSGAYEFSKEDLDFSDNTFQPEDWLGPLNDYSE